MTHTHTHTCPCDVCLFMLLPIIGIDYLFIEFNTQTVVIVVKKAEWGYGPYVIDDRDIYQNKWQGIHNNRDKDGR